MSRAVRWIKRWRAVEWACGVPRGVIMGFLWHRESVAKRYVLCIGSGVAKLKRGKTVDHAH